MKTMMRSFASLLAGVMMIGAGLAGCSPTSSTHQSKETIGSGGPVTTPPSQQTKGTDEATGTDDTTGKSPEPTPDTPHDKLKVVASFHAMAELTEAVAGDLVDLTTVVPGQSAAHGFEPKPKDLEALQEADLFIYNGQGMEGWVERALEAVDNPDLKVVDTSEGVDLIRIDGANDHDHDHEHDHDDDADEAEDHDDHDHDVDEADDHDEHDHDHDHDADDAHEHDHDHDHDADDHEHDDHDHDHDHDADDHDHDADDHDHDHDHDHHGHHHGPNDPHIWLGLTTAVQQVENIEEALSEADPANEATYEANAEAFEDKMESLLETTKEALEGAEPRLFVTGHAAFGYLARDLDLEQVSVQGVYAEGEPGAQQLAELVDTVRDAGVSTVFMEQLASPAVSETLAAEVGAEVQKIYTMESEEDGLSFLERVEANLKAIVDSFHKD